MEKTLLYVSLTSQEITVQVTIIQLAFCYIFIENNKEYTIF